jgi:hypothetical protein
MPKALVSSPISAYENTVEVESVAALEEIISDPDSMRMQALLVRERILGPAHPDTSYYIRYRYGTQVAHPDASSFYIRYRYTYRYTLLIWKLKREDTGTDTWPSSSRYHFGYALQLPVPIKKPSSVMKISQEKKIVAYNVFKNNYPYRYYVELSY